MTPPTAVFTASVIDGQVDHLNEQLPDFLGHPARTVTDSLELLAAVRATRQKLYDLEQSLERDAAKRMGAAKQIEWAGGVAKKRRTSTQVVWQSDDLLRAVAREAMVDKTTGEFPPDEVQRAVSEVLSAIGNAAAVGYWRVGQLELLGLDPYEYRTSTPGRWVVEVTVGEHESEQAS